LVLSQAGIEHQREVSLTPKDRPDFMVGGVAIELKVDGSAPEVTRQLMRYVQHPDVTGVVLVTTRQRHMCMPATMQGKPVRCLFVGRL
jgi:hypothetical protein